MPVALRAKQPFAVTRWWSRGDLNRRSCLAFSPRKRGRSPAVFGQNQPTDRSENNSLIGFSVVTPLNLRAFRKAPGATRGPKLRPVTFRYNNDQSGMLQYGLVPERVGLQSHAATGLEMNPDPTQLMRDTFAINPIGVEFDPRCASPPSS
jgi:hypothetical protein